MPYLLESEMSFDVFLDTLFTEKVQAVTELLGLLALLQSVHPNGYCLADNMPL